MNTASPVRGNLSSNNQPLVQTFAWPKDPQTGQYLKLEDFPKIRGIPETMYNYLVSTCGGVTATSANCADPTGQLRAQGIGGPTPMSGRLPVGFVLDPRTVGYTELSDTQRRRASAHERELNAKFMTWVAASVISAIRTGVRMSCRA